ncbi:uncharacterized protein LOC107215878 [Parus major]|uniref:uncharacterized protein LOC107215878 n=1 Tax=Parus major TaxID=9157 RepID=UPI0007713510|nr:uncharacterized protein LOC107215878 [Parus major]
MANSTLDFRHMEAWGFHSWNIRQQSYVKAGFFFLLPPNTVPQPAPYGSRGSINATRRGLAHCGHWGCRRWSRAALPPRRAARPRRAWPRCACPGRAAARRLFPAACGDTSLPPGQAHALLIPGSAPAPLLRWPAGLASVTHHAYVVKRLPISAVARSYFLSSAHKIPQSNKSFFIPCKRPPSHPCFLRVQPKSRRASALVTPRFILLLGCDPLLLKAEGIEPDKLQQDAILSSSSRSTCWTVIGVDLLDNSREVTGLDIPMVNQEAPMKWYLWRVPPQGMKCSLSICQWSLFCELTETVSQKRELPLSSTFVLAESPPSPTPGGLQLVSRGLRVEELW